MIAEYTLGSALKRGVASIFNCSCTTSSNSVPDNSSTSSSSLSSPEMMIGSSSEDKQCMTPPLHPVHLMSSPELSLSASPFSGVLVLEGAGSVGARLDSSWVCHALARLFFLACTVFVGLPAMLTEWTELDVENIIFPVRQLDYVPRCLTCV